MERSWLKSIIDILILLFSGTLMQEFKKTEAQLELPLDNPE